MHLVVVNQVEVVAVELFKVSNGVRRSHTSGKQAESEEDEGVHVCGPEKAFRECFLKH